MTTGLSSKPRKSSRDCCSFDNRQRRKTPKTFHVGLSSDLLSLLRYVHFVEGAKKILEQIHRRSKLQ
jgi:hypothetical protein